MLYPLLRVLLIVHIDVKLSIKSLSMFTLNEIVYIHARLSCGGYWMAIARKRLAHKHFRLDAAKIKRAQKVLRADTETEAIDRALDLAIAEHERDRLAWEAHETFLKHGIEIKDVFGKLSH